MIKPIRPTKANVSHAEYESFNEYADSTSKTQSIGMDNMRHLMSEFKKHTNPEMKKAAMLSGGSLKTKNQIDVQEICREVRGKL
ncbi:hypothetical protein [Paenibacillus sp. QZ-Y1]|uniref:hypothetical protein n=1 Tax=Paenibacillus sp. QZ-Y1 TaxID=3414511 RepID=UPI003F7A60C2